MQDQPYRDTDQLALVHLIERFANERVPVLLPAVFAPPGMGVTVDWPTALGVSEAGILAALTEWHLARIDRFADDAAGGPTPLSQELASLARRFRAAPDGGPVWARQEAGRTWQRITGQEARAMRVIAYLRVLTDIQAEKGLGLPVQAGAIRAWAKAERHKVTATYSDEGVSGSNGLSTRPGLATAFRDLEDGRADALVVYRLDRLARKLIHQETWIERLEQAGRKVVSITEPDYGEDETRVFVRQVFGALAEYERAVITRRLQSGRKAKAEQGGYAYGSPPYGWRSKDGELVPVPAEQAVLATMAAQRHAGRSYREIAGALNDAGTPARRGRWHPTTVARALGRAGKAGVQAILCGCGSPLVRDGAAWAHLYSEAAGAASDHSPQPVEGDGPS